MLAQRGATRNRYDCGAPPSTVLELGGKTLPLSATMPDLLTVVVRVWATDDPMSFVLRIEPATLEDWKGCKPPTEKIFGPPLRANFRRITF